jgi:hypothetical protein
MQHPMAEFLVAAFEAIKAFFEKKPAADAAEDERIAWGQEFEELLVSVRTSIEQSAKFLDVQYNYYEFERATGPWEGSDEVEEMRTSAVALLDFIEDEGALQWGGEFLLPRLHEKAKRAREDAKKAKEDAEAARKAQEAQDAKAKRDREVEERKTRLAKEAADRAMARKEWAKELYGRFLRKEITREEMAGGLAEPTPGAAESETEAGSQDEEEAGAETEYEGRAGPSNKRKRVGSEKDLREVQGKVSC